MSAELFALPFNGRCLRPQPEPPRPRLEKGCRVVWLPDPEEATVVFVSHDCVSIEWDESEFCTYNRTTPAVRECIAVLATDGAGRV